MQSNLIPKVEDNDDSKRIFLGTVLFFNEIVQKGQSLFELIFYAAIQEIELIHQQKGVDFRRIKDFIRYCRQTNLITKKIKKFLNEFGRINFTELRYDLVSQFRIQHHPQIVIRMMSSNLRDLCKENGIVEAANTLDEDQVHKWFAAFGVLNRFSQSFMTKKLKDDGEACREWRRVFINRLILEGKISKDTNVNALYNVLWMPFQVLKRELEGKCDRNVINAAWVADYARFLRDVITHQEVSVERLDECDKLWNNPMFKIVLISLGFFMKLPQHQKKN